MKTLSHSARVCAVMIEFDITRLILQSRFNALICCFPKSANKINDPFLRSRDILLELIISSLIVCRIEFSVH